MAVGNPAAHQGRNRVSSKTMNLWSLVADVRQRQQDYPGKSRLVEIAEVSAWSASRRLINITNATLSPLV